jgi:hypothetical protein
VESKAKDSLCEKARKARKRYITTLLRLLKATHQLIIPSYHHTISLHFLYNLKYTIQPNFNQKSNSNINMQLINITAFVALIVGAAAVPGAYSPPPPPPAPAHPKPSAPPVPSINNPQTVRNQPSDLIPPVIDKQLDFLLQWFSLLLLSRQPSQWRGKRGNYLCSCKHFM